MARQLPVRLSSPTATGAVSNAPRHARIGFRAVGEDAHEEHQHDRRRPGCRTWRASCRSGSAAPPPPARSRPAACEQAEADHEAALARRGPVGDGLDDGVRRPFAAEQDADGGEAGQRRAPRKARPKSARRWRSRTPTRSRRPRSRAGHGGRPACRRTARPPCSRSRNTAPSPSRPVQPVLPVGGAGHGATVDVIDQRQQHQL